MLFDNIGLKVPEIYMPRKGIDLYKWAVVACDQFTSQPDYWEKAKRVIGDDPSTMNLIYPEVYLEDETVNGEQLINQINENMHHYLRDGVLEKQKEGFVLIDRKTNHVKSRKGLVVALDLEKYDYNKGSTTLIRATEGTVLDRLPPRIKIREKASVELPHIMVLIDDPDKTVIEPLFNESLEKLTDFELMLDGGYIQTYRIDQPELLNQIAQRLGKLTSKEKMTDKYGSDSNGTLVYAMGDGNHSLATAKAIWEELKTNSDNKDGIMEHPARYALVELVNVHDEGLNFEPIHRVVFDVNVDDLLARMKFYFEDRGSQLTQTLFPDVDAALKQFEDREKGTHEHVFAFVAKGMSGFMTVNNPRLNLDVGSLQAFLDDYFTYNQEARVDYIHGADVVSELGAKEGNMGFYLPCMAKQDLFKTVYLDGALPRKTFSMGEAEEKRYYLECRKIVA
jgi:uncharacterized protein (DUF1015 family)